MKPVLEKRAIRCLDARIGLISNDPDLITNDRYFKATRIESLLTNIHRIADTEYEDVDADFIILDDPLIKPGVLFGGTTCGCAGDFRKWEAECEDLRYSLFGNLGLFFRYLLATMERHHAIFSFHASSMFIPEQNTLLLVMGGPGAGKSVCLLNGLMQGWKLFSTEITHFKLTDDGYAFYKGSLLDNIRLGTLIHDLPHAAEKLGIQIPRSEDEWEEQIAVDLSRFQADDLYENPRIRIVNVHVQSYRESCSVSKWTDREHIFWQLYKNASEKFASPWLMYGRIPVPGCDDAPLGQQRQATLRAFLDRAEIESVRSVMAGPRNCLEGMGLEVL
jgi:hypothetical protein